jgi:hypothetical protein
MAKYKIVCFIDNHEIKNFKNNSSERNYTGLIRAFGTDYLDNIFCNTFLYKQEGSTLKTIFNATTKFLLLSENSILLKEKVEVNDLWDILFVHDSVSVNELLSSYPQTFTNKTIVLYHKNATHRENDEVILKNLKQTYQILHYVKGQHENDIMQYYTLLSWLADSYNNATGFVTNKYNVALAKITDALYKEKLEIILEFLHGCLEKMPQNTDYQKLQEADIDISTLQPLIGKPYEKEYLGSLSILRDELLKRT